MTRYKTLKYGKPGKRGFTLVELMTGMLVSAVLALTVGATLVFTYKAWQSNNISVQSQNDYTIALEVIGKAIRESRISDISIDAGGSKLVLDANDVRANAIIIEVSGGNLVVNPDSYKLTAEGTANMLAEVDATGQTINIILQVVKPGQVHNTTVFASFSPRN